jgi:hypothetical protein
MHRGNMVTGKPVQASGQYVTDMLRPAEEV